VLQKLAQANALLARLVLWAFQQHPARFREERLSPALAERADLGAADLIDCVAQVLGDVKAPGCGARGQPSSRRPSNKASTCRCR
jgi:hypothetical protein